MSIKQEIEDMKQFKLEHGNKKFYQVMFKLFRYFILYPFSMIFFFYIGNYVFAAIFFVLTVYGLSMSFVGKHITEYIKQRQVDKIMKDMEDKDELQRANEYDKA